MRLTKKQIELSRIIYNNFRRKPFTASDIKKLVNCGVSLNGQIQGLKNNKCIQLIEKQKTYYGNRRDNWSFVGVYKITRVMADYLEENKIQ
jgi:hypothetical protein